jgi:hypothetical protein
VLNKIFPVPRSKPDEKRLDLYFDELLYLINLIDSASGGPVHDALRSLLLRLVEVGLLHDAQILKIGNFWTALGDAAKPRLKKRLEEILGCEESSLPPTLIEYISKVLQGSALQRGRREVDYNDYFRDVLEKHLEEKESRELRCKICGYHFMEADLGHERRRIAYDLDVIFALNVHPLRDANMDMWKPLRIDKGDGDSTRFLTKLTLDHIVPEEGFGWSEPDNLEIVCQLCNQGKMIYRHPLEAISLFAASGVSDYPENRGWSQLKQSTVAFTFELYDRRCWSCDRNSLFSELTVRRRVLSKGKSTKSEAFAPWNMVCLCYHCSGSSSN